MIKFYKDKELYAGFFILISDRIFVGISAIATFSLFARQTDTELVGAISLFLSGVLILVPFINLGMDGVLMRVAANNERVSRYFFLLTIGLRILLCTFFAAAASLIAKYLANEGQFFYFILGLISVSSIANLTSSYFKACAQRGYILILTLMALSSSWFFKLSILPLSSEEFDLPLFLIADSVFLAFFGIMGFLFKIFPINIWNNNIKENLVDITWTSIFKQSLPLMLSALAVVLYMRIDQLLVGWLLGTNAAAQYAIAIKFSEMIYILPIALAGAYVPSLLAKTTQETQDTIFGEAYSKAFWIATIVIISAFFISPYLISFLFGNQYQDSVFIAQIYLFSGLFVFFGQIYHYYLVGNELNKYDFYRTLAGLTCNVVFSLLFINLIGIQGAAFATIIAYFVSDMGYDLMNKKTKKHFWLKLNSPVFFLKRVSI